MDIGNNTKMEFEMTDKEDPPWMSIFIKSEPVEYDFDEDNFRQNNDISNNGNNNNLPKDEKPIIRLEEFKTVQTEDTINNHVGNQNFPTHIEIEEQVFIPIHKCLVCFEDFSTLQFLKTHMLTHANNNDFVCDVCGKRFIKEIYLRRHKSRHLRPSTDCRICKRRFDTNFRLSVHMRIHTGEKPYECDVCKEKFSSKKKIKWHLIDHLDNNGTNDCPICGKGIKAYALKSHMLRKHSNGKPFECKLCERRFSSMTQLKSHMLFHENSKFFKCDVCLKLFSTTGYLRKHKKTHENTHPEHTPYECDFCNRKFARRFKIQDHIFFHIGDGGEHKCEFCKIGFSTPKMLKRHNREHLKYNICTFCHQRFLNRKELTHHLLVHSDMKPFNCKRCDECFKKPSQLDIHRRKHCKEIKRFECDICKRKFRSHNWIKEHIISHIGDGGVHMCEICGAGFSIPYVLKRHLQGHLNYKMHKLFECEVCKDRFLKAYDLAQHMLLHSEAFVCRECGKSFKKNSSLKIHERIHFSDKSFKCDVCNEKLLTIAKLKKHMLALHLNIKLYECQFCYRPYSEWSKLNRHKIREHKTSFTCSKCNRGFVRKYNLENHLRQHLLDEKSARQKKEQTFPTQLQSTSLECNICKAKFKDSYRLKFHMVAHTGDGGPIKCSVCKKGFSIPYVLKLHMQEHKNRKSKTVKKLFECEVCKKRFKYEKNLKSHKMIHVKNKSKKSSDEGIKKQKVLCSVRLKSEIKSEVLDENNSKGERDEKNLMTERENSSFISVKKEACAAFDFNHDLDIEDVKIFLKSER